MVVSHCSAARVFGLPRPLAGWPQPEFTTSRGPTRRRAGVHIRVASMVRGELLAGTDFVVTSPARILADCLRTLPEPDALAMVDAALHRGLVTEAAVLECLGRQAKWPGIARARRLLTLADGRRESPLESWSALALAENGVPAPQWQVELRDRQGHLLGRVDCWWPAGVAGEADGRSKYALASAERGGGAGAVFDVLHPTPAGRLARRITAALAQAGHIAPTMLPVATEIRRGEGSGR